MSEDVSTKPVTFQDFKLELSLYEGIETMGYSEPTPIQSMAIPVILENRDLIGCAQTGTGKTAAFVIPIIHRIIQAKEAKKGINTLVIVPTRELALQIDQQISGLGYFTNISSTAVYGGGDGLSWDQQKKALSSGADIIIATPGRLIAHLQMKYLNFQHIQHLVLDEADRMLDMGFYGDIIKIVSALPEKRQTMMFSATMPTEIRKLAGKLLHQPTEINLALAKPAEGILQAIYKVKDQQKLDLLLNLLKGKDLTRILLFSTTKKDVKSLHKSLVSASMVAEAIHSDLEQKEREAVLLRFKSGHTKILVATDIVSRGIDIDNIDLVINYNVPQDAEDYVHRVGRTARAKSTGVAITFVNPTERGRLERIEKLIGYRIYEIAKPN
jgi:superfamily II DNA/RNA helicase